MSNNYIVRGSDESLSVRVFAAKTTDMVEKARQTHNTSAVASAALGRSLTIGAILGIMGKGEKDKVTLQIKGGGPIGSVVIVSNTQGKVKGYVDHPEVQVDLREDGKLDVGKAVGCDGRLTIIKDLGLKEPYVGKNDLVNGEIGEDMTAYFTFSEQIPSSVGLGVLVDKDYSIKAAGGFVIQLMPDATDETIDILEKNLSSIKSVTKLIEEGKTPEEMVDMLLDGLGSKIYEKIDVDYECDCSRERIEAALVTIGKKDLEEILEKDKQAEIQCHFCNTKYMFDENDLKSMIENL